MSVYSVRSSRPDRWSNPVQAADPMERMVRYGRIQPMEEPSLLERLFRPKN